MADDLPQWVQNLIYIGTIAGSTVGAVILGRKKGDPEKGLSGERKGEGVVVAASFMERQAMLDLTTSIRNLDSTSREMLELFREIHREQEIERAVRNEMAKRKGDI